MPGKYYPKSPLYNKQPHGGSASIIIDEERVRRAKAFGGDTPWRQLESQPLPNTANSPYRHEGDGNHPNHITGAKHTKDLSDITLSTEMQDIPPMFSESVKNVKRKIKSEKIAITENIKRTTVGDILKGGALAIIGGIGGFGALSKAKSFFTLNPKSPLTQRVVRKKTGRSQEWIDATQDDGKKGTQESETQG